MGVAIPPFEFIDIELEGFRALLANRIKSFSNQIGESTAAGTTHRAFCGAARLGSGAVGAIFQGYQQFTLDCGRKTGASYDNLVRTGRRKLGEL